MRIAVLMLRSLPGQTSPVMREVVRLLSEWGADLTVIYPEEELTALSGVRVEHDLYILKSRTDMALSLAGALHAGGAAILNPYPVSNMLRDKIFMTRILQSAGVPTPETYVTAHPEQLAPLLDSGPLIVKPYRGSGSRGVFTIWDADELDDVPSNRGPIFAQRYQPPHGHECRLYCIGGQTFGVKRVWPARTYEEKMGEPFTLTAELHEIALRCGQALGLEMYGVDVVDSDHGVHVVDVSSFPSFKGVPDAALRLADYIYAAAVRAVNGDPLLESAGKEHIA